MIMLIMINGNVLFNSWTSYTHIEFDKTFWFSKAKGFHDL